MEIKPLDILGELEVQPLDIEIEPLNIEVQPLEVTTLDTELIMTIAEPDEIACDIPDIDAAELDELREEMQRECAAMESDPDIKRMLRESEKELEALENGDGSDCSESTSCSGS